MRNQQNYKLEIYRLFGVRYSNFTISDFRMELSRYINDKEALYNEYGREYIYTNTIKDILPAKYDGCSKIDVTGKKYDSFVNAVHKKWLKPKKSTKF